MALLALFVSAYTVYVQRQQLKVQAWPRLELAVDHEAGESPGDAIATLKLVNRGVAPGEVKWVHTSREGKTFNDWIALVDAIHDAHKEAPPVKVYRGRNPVGAVVGVGQDFPLLAVNAAALNMIDWDDKMGLAICYCSLLEDCWTFEIANGKTRTSASESCPHEENGFVGIPSSASPFAPRADAGAR